ncbi:MAG: hypothetical protein K2X03_22680 [Bryobacteraceae bacterium]|nr:hypothetical protein [Bryobacteraceae bacterium]
MIPITSREEKDAVRQVLESGEFARSPNLERIFRYVCDQYFRGESDRIKEYTIALEALGRGEDFDPKKDSIVRVEVHRLRRRLEKYYETRGAGDALRITIPEKSYVPSFRPAHPAALAVPLLAVPILRPVSEPEPLRPPPGRNRPAAWLIGLVGVLAVLLAWLGWASLLKKTKTVLPPAEVPAVVEAPPLASATATGDEIRILAGRPPGRYFDRQGHSWEGDRYFKGGSPAEGKPNVLAHGLDNNLFAGFREGDFQYDIPLKPGSYELMLAFAETVFGEANLLGGGSQSRSFALRANGRTLLDNFDPQSEAMGENQATYRVFRDITPGPDGLLHLRFDSSVASSKAFVNAIQLRPGTPGKTRPIRIVCRNQRFRDSRNRIWEPDQYYRSGIQILRPTGAPVAESDLYRGERYGRFSYIIPVPQGKYTAKLYFWEYWWGAGHQGGGGLGSRVFDVFCNFQPLLQHFDILRESPTSQAVEKVFRGLRPNEQGQLIFDFVPQTNFAMLNALEITDDTP